MRQTKIPRATALFLATAAVGLTHAAARAAAPAFTFDQAFFDATVGDTGGIPNPGRSQAAAINDAGQITGYTLATTGGVNGTTTQYYRGYVYTSISGATPALQPLPALAGITSIGRGINASGQVVGLSSTSDSASTAYHATRWNTPAQAVDVPPPAGFVSSSAAGVSDNGQVCGSLFPTATGFDVGERAFKTVSGQAVALPNLSGITHSDGYGINNAGTVAGYSDNPNGTGFILGNYWDASGVHPITPIGGDYSIVYQINNNGVTAGGSTIAADNEAEVAIVFDTTTGVTKNLGGINAAFRYAEAVGLTGDSTLDNPTVVGVAYNADFTDEHAFVYLNGTMYDLNDAANLPAGMELQYAYGINAGNQIVGQGIDADGNQRAFLLNLSSVPEPASLGLLVGAMALTLGRRRRTAATGSLN